MKKCILCKGINYRRLFCSGNYTVSRCQKCQLVFTNEAGRVDYKNYHRDEEYGTLEAYFRNIFSRRHRLASGYFLQPGKVLDIGCSRGTLLQFFKKKGWEVWGIESSSSAKVAIKRGIRVLKKPVEKANLPGNYFDLIVLNHTLEHLKNPVEVLKKLWLSLKPEGLLLVDVPNFGSLASRILKSNWSTLVPDEHLFHFEPKTLKMTFEKAGYQVISIKSASGLLDLGNPLVGIWQGVILGRKRVILEIIGLPFSFLTSKMLLGESLTMIGRKPARRVLAK